MSLRIMIAGKNSNGKFVLVGLRTNVSLISASEAKEKFPLLDEDSIMGAMWDPDAGLVVPYHKT